MVSLKYIKMNLCIYTHTGLEVNITIIVLIFKWEIFFLVPKFQLKNLKQSAPSNVLNLFVKKKHTHTYFEINSSETAKTLV